MLPTRVYCPCRLVENCTGGIGKGYTPSYLIRHLKIVHLAREEDRNRIKATLERDMGFYDAMINALKTMGQ